MIINNLKDPVVKAFWVHEYEQWREQFRNEAIAPIQNKVGPFLSTSIIRNVVGQPKSTIDIFKIMNEGKIFLVNVSKGRIGEDNSALLGGMIITKIQLATMERVRIPEDERKDFYLYVDEFQNFATDAFANILSEARKYRLNLTVAHQYTAQLENKDSTKVRDAVFGNVGTMIVFRVGADDAEFLEKEFEPEFMTQDLVNLPNYHIYLKLMIDGVTSRPFSATTLPPLKVDPASSTKEKVIEMSRKLYTRSRQEVEDQINKWSGMLQSAEGDMKYKADCSNCKKSTMVPFEPQEGRPIYCKECMFKIKTGEQKPESGFSATRSARQTEGASTGPLAELGIEFNSSGLKAAGPRAEIFMQHKENNRKPFNKNQAYNNSFQTQRPQNTYNQQKKRSGPSPLLKGLLDKIRGQDRNNHLKNNEETEIIPVKINTPPPVSLSTLRNPEPSHPIKPAGAKILVDKSASEEGKNALKDLLAKTSASQPIIPNWQKKPPKKEVPEEVLKKVLEE
jgi:CxxC-x17-CxxC domain-containing protein